MTFQEIYNTVQALVLRPDLEAYLAMRMFAAITACHSETNLDLDRLEESVTLVTPTAKDSVDVPADFRDIELVLTLDDQGNVGDALELLKPSEVIKRKRLNTHWNTAYLVDGKLSFQASEKISGVLITGWTLRMEPSIRYNLDGTSKLLDDPAIANYTTWLMQRMPEAFIDYAAGYLEILQGNVEQGRSMLQMYNAVHAPAIRNIATQGDYN